ncbi:MAG: hypothetical protein MAG453_02112 [Calditrichaeota bacterium]|nr:hypothetical protein [Calditrichota bacterium]
MIEQRGKGHGSTPAGDRRRRIRPVCVLAIAVLLAGFAGQSAANRNPWSWKQHTGLQLLYEAGYNSNILELSAEDIDRFLDGDLTLASPLETYDDFAQSVGVRFRLTLPKWWGWRNGGLTYTFRYLNFVTNPFNDRPIHNLYFSHDLIERVDVFASYLYIPQRFLRDYYDRDLGTVLGTHFDYSLGGVGLRYSPESVKGLRLSARYELFTIYYNEYFTEYDSEGSGLRFDIRYRFNRDFTLTGTAKRRWSDNVGFEAGALNDPFDPEAVDAEYGDGSYGEEWFELDFDWAVRGLLPDKRRLDLEASARLRHRFYTSDRPVERDPIHAGREHMHWRFSVAAGTKLAGRLSGGPVLEYEFRRTESPLDWVVETKDFDTFRAMLSLTYRLR